MNTPTDPRERKTFDVYAYDVPASSTVELEETTRPVQSGDRDANPNRREEPAPSPGSNKHEKNAKSPRFFQLYMGHDDDIVMELPFLRC